MSLKDSPMPETKTQLVYKQLYELAHRLGPGAQLPPMRILSSDLQTTRVTVHEAMDRLVAENILYRKQRQGTYVSPTLHHKNIRILFNAAPFTEPTITPFWSLLLQRLQQEAEYRSEQQHLLYQTNFVKPTHDVSYSEEIQRIVHTERVDGILAVLLNTKNPNKSGRQAIPCVTFAADGEWVVQFNGTEFGRLGTQALIQRGCRKIGLWGPSDLRSPTLNQELQPHMFPNVSMENRLEFHSFRQVLAEHNIPYYPELTRQSYISPFPRTMSLQEQGYLLAREVFNGPVTERPDGIFITDDMLTDGALVALTDMGIRVGRDIHIATHANAGSPMLFGRTRDMVLIEFVPDLIVQAMYSMLDDLMHGRQLSSEVTWIAPRLRPEISL